MAQFKIGNMFDAPPPDLLCFTANATIKANGALVMGKGAAEEARDRFPGIDLKLGEIIKNYQISPPRKYGLLVILWPGLSVPIGIFQVKYHWKDIARLDLIRYSTVQLFKHIIYSSPQSIYLNFPGIGNGQLAEADVLPIISLLPDNVTIWRLP